MRTLASGGSVGMAGESSLMASFLYGSLWYPPSASFLVSLEKSAVHLSWTQASHRRPVLKSGLTMAQGSPPLTRPLRWGEAHPACPLPWHWPWSFAWLLQMPSSLALPLQILLFFSDPVLAPSLFFQKNPPPVHTTHLHSRALTGLNQIQPYWIIASYLSNYLFTYLERVDILESDIYLVCLVISKWLWMSYLTSVTSKGDMYVKALAQSPIHTTELYHMLISPILVRLYALRGGAGWEGKINFSSVGRFYTMSV